VPQLKRGWSNWSHSVRATPAQVLRVKDRDDIVDALAAARAGDYKVRAAGQRGSFAPLIPTDGVVLDLRGVRGLVSIDTAGLTATFRTGTRMDEVNGHLARNGLALRSMGTNATSSAGGSVLTGTHGSYIAGATMAAQVSSMQLVDSSGRDHTLTRSKGERDFDIGRLSLGVLGVVTEVTFDCVPAFNLDVTYTSLPVDEVGAACSTIMSTHSFASVWWHPLERAAIVRRAEPVRPGDDSVKPTRADSIGSQIGRGNPLFERVLLQLAAIARFSNVGVNALAVRAANSTTLKPRSNLPSAAVLTVDQPVRFIAMEYAVPAAVLGEVLAELTSVLTPHWRRMPWPIEIRFGKRDELPLSLCYARDTAFINIPVTVCPASVALLLAAEAVFKKWEGRPHLAKIHTADGDELGRLYPALTELRSLRDRMDPTHMFGNPYTDQVLSGDRDPSLKGLPSIAG
jgi:L-gulonolactone oxidase